LAGTFFFGFGVGTHWVLLNLYFREFGLPEGLIGRILSFESLGTLLMAIPAAILAGRMRLKWLLVLAAVATAVTSGLLVVIPWIGLLYLVAVLTGGSFIVHHVVSAPFFMRNSTPKERIYLFGINYSVEVLTSVVGVAAGGWLAAVIGEAMGSDLMGLRLTLLGASAVLGLAVIPYLFIHSPPPLPEERNAISMFKVRRPELLAKLVTPNFVLGMGAGLIIPFLNLYFRDRFDLGSSAIGQIFAVSQGLTAVGFAVGPILARRFGMIQAIVAAELLSIPFFITLAFTPHLEIAIVAFWFRGALMNMNHPINRNFAMEAVESKQQAFTNAVLEMSWSISWVVSTQIGGILIERYGFTLPMVITVGLYLVSSFLLLFFFHDYERKVLVPKRKAEAAEQP
jgi:predicted MFS family arabinose efflux permease